MVLLTFDSTTELIHFNCPFGKHTDPKSIML